MSIPNYRKPTDEELFRTSGAGLKALLESEDPTVVKKAKKEIARRKANKVAKKAAAA